MTEERANEIASAMSRRFAMAYIMGSIANAYLEEGIEDMRTLRVYKHEAKRLINNATHYFDLYNTSLKNIFSAAGSNAFGQRVIADYELLKDTCDRYMNAEVYVGAYEAWNSDALRSEGEYLCYLDGDEETCYLLRWKDKRWLYCHSVKPPIWRELDETMCVNEVIDRVVK